MPDDALSKLRSLAAGKRKQHKRLLKKLGSGSNADSAVFAAHAEVFACTDCLACANCCKTTGPLFTSRDIEKLANRLRIKPGQFISQYLRKDEDGDLVLQTLPCPFLGEDNYCSVYSDRPRACREYPHTNQSGQAGLAHLTIKNAAVCPAVFNILEKLEKQI